MARSFIAFCGLVAYVLRGVTLCRRPGQADPEVLVGGSGLGRLHLAKEGYLRFSEEIGLQLPMQPAAAAQKADPMQKTAAWA